MVQILPKATTNDHIDPLSYAIAPAINESPEERINRLKAEEQAKKLSDDIDRFLKKSAIGTDGTGKKSQSVKVLLLGQSESGKSTALKSASRATPTIITVELTRPRNPLRLSTPLQSPLIPSRTCSMANGDPLQPRTIY